MNEINQLKEEIRNHKCNKETNNENNTNSEKYQKSIEYEKVKTIKPAKNYNQMIKPDITPGDGEHDDPDTIPGATWAQVVNRRRKPKVEIPEEILEINPEYKYNEETKDNPNRLSEEEHEEAKKALAASALIIGLKPITKKHIEMEERRYLTENQETNLNKGQLRIKAVKNSIMRFLKDNLNMDEKSRNLVQIQKIYPNDDKDFDTMYVKCQTEEDITSITRNARNLPKTGGEEKPTLVPHIPPQFYARYQSCEKILHKIRATERGKYQTNLRFGKTDILIRYREKGDTTQWSEIPTIKIPPGVPPPEVKLKKNSQNPPNQKKMEIKPATRKKRGQKPTLLRTREQ